jgi:ribA/ribD-fused uncharacterized protein
MTDEKFTFFWSGPFSQWHPSPFEIDGIWYNCAEQYMMAEKAKLFGDSRMHDLIMSATDPWDQKRFGRLVDGFDGAVWEEHAKKIVYRGSEAKYGQNPELRKELLATAGTTLVEASPEDCIWGIGLGKDDPGAQNRETWLGTNWLGEVLTELRQNMTKRDRE